MKIIAETILCAAVIHGLSACSAMSRAEYLELRTEISRIGGRLDYMETGIGAIQSSLASDAQAMRAAEKAAADSITALRVDFFCLGEGLEMVIKLAQYDLERLNFIEKTQQLDKPLPKPSQSAPRLNIDLRAYVAKCLDPARIRNAANLLD